MKKHLLTFSCAMALAGAFTVLNTFASESAAPEPPDPAMLEAMKRAKAAGTPGPAHELLEALVGKWNVEVKSWMAPDTPPIVTQGDAETAWILDGRFLEEKFNGEFMGNPFHGIAILGFDNIREKYNHVWIDNVKTSMYVSQGEASGDGKEIIFKGKADCPMTGKKDMPLRQVLRFDGENGHVLEMFNESDGGDFKMMEITYTRK